MSIIIPAYNEERRLPSTLEKIAQFISQQTYNAEIVVVENGSTDRTSEIAKFYENEYPGPPIPGKPSFRLISEAIRGKGNAVKRGMLESHGNYLFMCDADLSMPITELERFIPPKLTDFDIAIGSREADGSIRFNEPHYRHLGGRAVNTMIRLLALPELHDTQCGFKCFRGRTAADLFKKQTLTGWSFDIELLFIARKRKLKIVEIPIPWYFNPESKLNVIQDTIHMGIDILKIRLNALLGKYNE